MKNLKAGNSLAFQELCKPSLAWSINIFEAMLGCYNKPNGAP